MAPWGPDGHPQTPTEVTGPPSSVTLAAQGSLLQGKGLQRGPAWGCSKQGCAFPPEQGLSEPVDGGGSSSPGCQVGLRTGLVLPGTWGPAVWGGGPQHSCAAGRCVRLGQRGRDEGLTSGPSLTSPSGSTCVYFPGPPARAGADAPGPQAEGS